MPTEPRPAAVAIAAIGTAEVAWVLREWSLGLGHTSIHAKPLVDHPLLGNRQDVVGEPVQHKAGREQEEHKAKDERHDPHHLGL